MYCNVNITYAHNVYMKFMYAYRSDQHFAIEAAANNNISDARVVFDSLDWSVQSYRMFEHIGQTEEHVHICASSTDEVCTWFDQ